VIDFITRYISALSLAVVTTLSILNIGYFWKIGLPFLGLIDFSNLVYSLGVSLTVIFVAGVIASMAVRKDATPVHVLTTAVIGSAISLIGIFRVSFRSLDPQLSDNSLILIGFVMGGSALASRVWGKPEARSDWRNLAVLGLGWSAIAFQAGVCQAALDLSDRFKYSVSTKSGVIDNARILRSSSSGFLLAVDGKIRFVPHGEIKDVTSQVVQ
jgi:hypothetical protein